VAGGDVIEITHEEIANHIASAREAVTRMLKFFQNERLISVGRGKIEIIDFSRLNKIASA
jgi:CRP/FNR family transcriptional regulator